MTPFQLRRQKLLNALPEKSIVLVASGGEKIRNRDVEYPFRVESDFYYLSGFQEPESILLLIKKEAVSSHVFLRSKDKEKEIWNGRRLGVEAAPDTLKVDYAWDNGFLDEKLSELIENIDSVYFSFARLSEWTPHLDSWIQKQKAKSRKGISAPFQFYDLDTVLHEMRLIKSHDEIDLMRKAASLSVAGHLKAMEKIKPGQFEYQVQSFLEQEFKEWGAARVAFNSIVAGGENACILHYTENDQVLNEGELVLIDAGAEFKGYAGDITQTFPVSGKFSEPQKALYELTLKAQQAAISVIRPGVSYEVMHDASVRVITEGLLKLGIMKGELDELIEKEAYKAYFMHGTGHWLGLDVHDVGRYKIDGQWRILEPGMILTVEPGIYISAETGKENNVSEAYWNIGIRIEGDVLVTEDGHEVLTKGLPRTVAEIEAFMAGKNSNE